jgi:predicted dehydrogenase
MAMKKKIRVGIVGAAFGRYGLSPAFRMDPRCELVAISAASIEHAQEAAKNQGIPDAVAGWEGIVHHPNIDAVAIATPPYIQPKIAMAALTSKKAVFAEKPLALCVQDAVSLYQMALSTRLANVVDFIFPELETWQYTKRLVREGAIGKLRHVGVDWRFESYDHQRRLHSWKTNSDLGGGALQHFASHSLYYLEWLFGPIVGLFSKLFSAPDLDQSGDTFVVLAAQFADCLSASLTLTNAAPFGSGHRLEIYGSDGSLRLVNAGRDPVRGFQLLIATRDQSSFREIALEPSVEPDSGIDTRVRPVSRLAARFLDWIGDDTATVPSFHEALRVQRLIEAAQQSAKSGRWIDCPMPSG